uniref:Protein kinase domain-containing protein n=1 Tax=Oryza nivara TaxID=4536 RepID=A0A0E0FFZ1_ORYNI
MNPKLLFFPLLATLLLLCHPAHAECEPATCSNLTVRYPFWLGGPNLNQSSPSSASCGHPAFEVWCSPDGVASLRGSQILVLSIDYTNSSFVVAHKRVADGGDGVCRTDFNISSSLALSPFTVSSSNLAICFLYSCNGTEPPEIDGLVNATIPSCSKPIYSYLGGSYDRDKPPAMKDGNCTYSYLPVLWPEPPVNLTAGTNYSPQFKKGFVLEWQKNGFGDCDACNASGGQCRYINDSAAAFACLCSDGKLRRSTCAGSKTTGRTILIVLTAAAAGLLLPCIYVLIWHKKGKKLRYFLCTKTSSTSERNIEALIVSYGSIAPTRYKYSEVTKITSFLNYKLGEGGYGVVFKGKLQDDRLVAVKFLHDSKGNGEEFVNEVMSIGRTSHINIVSLFGFCLEGSKRALLYEYMPNGSLDNYIYSENPKEILGWEKLYEIAIGIARGLEYLHHRCNTRIIHFDIKPQNILLDQDFCPKIADFGLAKLCRTKESKLSMTGARGTIGFIAPEVIYRSIGIVSTKSDVYSYGMMLLEMVGGRKNAKSMVENSSARYFPDWIYDHFALDDGLQACEVTSEVEQIAKKMTLIGLWCVQVLPMHRPTITQVLDMFERSLDELEMPPKQNFKIIQFTSWIQKVQVILEIPNLHKVLVNCAPRRCGNVTIAYPFWLPDSSPPPSSSSAPCGPAAFQVNCDNGSRASLARSFRSGYKILGVSYANRTVVVANDNVQTDASGCPVPKIDVSASLSLAPFTASPANSQLVFLFNCTSSSRPPPAGFVNVTCPGAKAVVRLDTSYNNTAARVVAGGCDYAAVPVVGVPGASPTDYPQLLRGGYMLEWRAPAGDCMACNASGGQCGYDADTEAFACICSDGSSRPGICDAKKSGNKVILIVSLSICATGLVLLACIAIVYKCRRRMQNRFSFLNAMDGAIRTDTAKVEKLLQSYGSLAPRRFRYSELKKITKSFSQRLGEGGYGTVFSGALADGRAVAVKFLHHSKPNGEEFLNEVVSIGRTSHVNIVSLLGFCLEGSKRALVYEYMPNGSLDKYIYSTSAAAAEAEEAEATASPDRDVLEWKVLQEIAVGVARGLEYLHDGCNTRIIHFDIKPHNVLLDEGFRPKIADFGMAKLCNPKESILSMADTRGTIGFIAPEVFSRGFGDISTKSDVYSYGMLLLEMVGGGSNVKAYAEKGASGAFFPLWVYDHLLEDGGVLQSVAAAAAAATAGGGAGKPGGEEIARKMALIGLWCIQTVPANRPSMGKVLEMLERSVHELAMPPRPYHSNSSSPSRPSSYPSSASDFTQRSRLSTPGSTA